jgi:plastocyanin
VVVDPGNSTETEATYTVYPGHHENHVFDSWDDGNTTKVRTLTITENMTITANYVEAEHTITIPSGAFDPENPPYLPEVLTVERGDTVVVFNEDTAPHSVTSGTGPEDPTAANLFETGLMFEGQYAHVETEDLDAGDYDYYCFVHPFMQGVLTVTE